MLLFVHILNNSDPTLENVAPHQHELIDNSAHCSLCPSYNIEAHKNAPNKVKNLLNASAIFFQCCVSRLLQRGQNIPHKQQLCDRSCLNCWAGGE